MHISLFMVFASWWHIQAAYAHHAKQAWLSKLLVMVAAVGLAFSYRSIDYDGSHAWILLGLFLYLAGDLLLQHKSQRFLQGLPIYTAAHLCYLIAFLQGPLLIQIVDGIVLLGITASFFFYLWRVTGLMKWPLMLHMLVLVALAWAGISSWHANWTAGSSAAFIGSLLLLISDMLLAVHLYHHRIYTARALSMICYFSAHFLLAASLAS